MSVITQQIVRCPNCGSEARRRHFSSEETAYRPCPSHQVLQTECDACDYLMVMCSRNGAVVEAHSPGTAGVADRKNFPQHRLLTVESQKKAPRFLVAGVSLS